MGRICTIHQPNFMPWYPFFQKMAAADVFILLTNCQYEKNGYQNRFKFQDRWCTMSVRHGLEPIYDKRYCDSRADWNRIKNKLPEQYKPILDSLDWCISDNLLDTNKQLIYQLRRLLKIQTRMTEIRSDGTRTERLVDLCRLVRADTYLSGISGKEYLDLELFKKAGITVKFQSEQDMDKRHSLEVIACD